MIDITSQVLTGRRLRVLAVFVAAGLALTGCVSVKPLAEAQSGLGDRVVDVDGQRVYVEQDGRGEVIVLLHGFGASSYSWREVVPELARHYRVVAPDLSGFGWTERPEDFHRYTREGQIDMVLGLMDHLGIESAHFVGHSYGGALTMALAGEHPERVRSMVLVNSAAIDYPTERRRWFAGTAPLSYAYVRGLALRPSFIRRLFLRAYYDDSLVTDELVRSYLDRLRVEGAVHGYRGLTRPLHGEERSREIRYEDLDVPALVVWGAEDQLATLEMGRSHADLLPNHRFVAIEGAGHAPMEERPEDFLRAVTAFLAEVGRVEGSSPSRGWGTMPGWR